MTPKLQHLLLNPLALEKSGPLAAGKAQGSPCTKHEHKCGNEQ
jgi:hypothetical protein